MKAKKREAQYEPGPVLKKLVKNAIQSEMTEFRILVCGSRDWDDIDTINKHLCKLIVEFGVKYQDVLVISGGAPGADTLVETLCNNELGIACATFNAPWVHYRKIGNPRAAGSVRNSWMLRWGRPHAVLGFHPYLPGSRGTKNMLEQARQKGVPIIRHIEGPKPAPKKGTS